MGILLVLVSAASFGSVAALFVKPLYAAGMTVLVLLAWRFLTAAAVSWGYLLASSRTRASLRLLTRRRAIILLLLGALYVGNSFTYIGALEVVPISLNSIIAYLYPAIVAVMALRLVRRLEGRRAWFALGLSLDRRGPGAGWRARWRDAAAVGPGALVRQPLHLRHLDRLPVAPGR